MTRKNDPSTMLIPLVSNELPTEERIIRFLTDKFPMFGKENASSWEQSAPEDVLWVLPARIPGLPHIVFIWPENAEELPDNVWWHSNDVNGELKEIYDNCKYVLVVETVLDYPDILKQWKLLLETTLALSDDSPFVYDDSAMKLLERAEAETIIELPIDPSIQDAYSFHAEYDEAAPDKLWLHTHGLGRLGLKDMDALGVSRANREIAVGLFSILADKQLNDPYFDEESIFLNDYVTLKFADLIKALQDNEITIFGNLLDRDDFHLEKRVLILEEDDDNFIFNLGSVNKRFSIDNALKRLKEKKFVWQTQAEIDRETQLAQYRWPVFYSLFRIRERYNWKFLIKAAFVSTGDASFSELLWFELSDIRDKMLIGRLLSAPIAVNDMQKGDTVEFNQKDVAGWSVATDDGNYYPMNVAALALKAGIQVKSPAPVH